VRVVLMWISVSVLQGDAFSGEGCILRARRMMPSRRHGFGARRTTAWRGGGGTGWSVNQGVEQGAGSADAAERAADYGW